MRRADQRLRPSLRLFDQLARVRLRLVDRVVGRALGEEQRALQHLGVVAVRGQGRRVARTTAFELLQLAREVLDRRGGALEEIVDLVAVEATERFLDLTATEFLRGDIHAGHGSDGPPANRVMLPGTFSGRQALAAAADRRMRITKNTTMNEVSSIPAGGITRRTGRRTGSVRSMSSLEREARKVPSWIGNHEITARPPRMMR
jgi:hypothetical protein